MINTEIILNSVSMYIIKIMSFRLQELRKDEKQGEVITRGLLNEM